MSQIPTGLVFGVQRYSLHDGPGIRTVVFLKGCPLRCTWCCNPESQGSAPELAFNPSRCLGPELCGRCVGACPEGALTGVAPQPGRCVGCFACVEACPAGARTVYGQHRTVDDVLREVEADDLFYARSGGGLTLSGGEPLAQPDFALALLREAKARRLHTALETCGHVTWKTLEAASRHLDVLLFDLKHADPVAHARHTGASNERILKNLARVRDTFPALALHVRTPVIPGVNDDEATLDAIRALVPEGATWERLPYHRMGQPKYGYLGRPVPTFPQS